MGIGNESPPTHFSQAIEWTKKLAHPAGHRIISKATPVLSTKSDGRLSVISPVSALRQESPDIKEMSQEQDSIPEDSVPAQSVIPENLQLSIPSTPSATQSPFTPTPHGQQHPGYNIRGLSYRVPPSRQRNFASMPDFPLRFLVVGDAFCNMNPVFGQGISNAAIGINSLLNSLKDATLQDDGSVMMCGDDWFQPSLDSIRGRLPLLSLTSWSAAAAEDLSWPTTTTNLPSYFVAFFRVSAKLLEMLHHAMSIDDSMFIQFVRVLTLQTSIFSAFEPGVLLPTMYHWLFSKQPKLHQTKNAWAAYNKQQNPN